MQNNNETLTPQQGIKQKDIVLNAVLNAGDKIRTDQVRIIAFKQSVSCADVYLRELAQENKIARFWELIPDPKNPKNKIRSTTTKYWSSPQYFENNVKPYLNEKYVL